MLLLNVLKMAGVQIAGFSKAKGKLIVLKVAAEPPAYQITIKDRVTTQNFKKYGTAQACTNLIAQIPQSVKEYGS